MHVLPCPGDWKSDICSFQALSKEGSSSSYHIAGSTPKAEKKNFQRLGKQIPLYYLVHLPKPFGSPILDSFGSLIQVLKSFLNF